MFTLSSHILRSLVFDCELYFFFPPIHIPSLMYIRLRRLDHVAFLGMQKSVSDQISVFAHLNESKQSRADMSIRLAMATGPVQTITCHVLIHSLGQTANGRAGAVGSSALRPSNTAIHVGRAIQAAYGDPHNGRMMPPALQCSSTRSRPVRRHSWAEP